MLRFIINGQRLSLVTGKVVSGTHNYLTAELDCHGPDWNGLRKWAHFKMGDEVHYVLPMHDDRITEEQHLDLTGGTWTVYIHGNRVEDEEVTERVTTNEVYLFVEGQFDASVFPPLTPEFEEVLAYEVEHAIDVAQSVRDDADAGEFDGATFTPNVSEEGIISWTNDQGKENPEPQNIKGPKGDIGPNAVYIGHEEPTDPGCSVWVDPEGGVGKVIMSWDYVPSQIHEPHTPGTYDDYLITFSDGTTLTVSVYNGVDGEGTGDMAKSVYDTGNKATDIFAYADAAASAAAGEVQDSVDNLGEALDDHIEDTNNPHQVTAAQVGLGNVDNTADADKPISDATQSALDEKANTDDLATVAFTGAYSDLSGTPTIDTALNASSNNAVQNRVITAALSQKQNVLTIDSALSASSTNPVQNKAIKAAIDALKGGNVAIFQTNTSITFDAGAQGTGIPSQVNVQKAGYRCLGCMHANFSSSTSPSVTQGSCAFTVEKAVYTSSGDEVRDIISVFVSGLRGYAQSLPQATVYVRLDCLYAKT